MLEGEFHPDLRLARWLPIKPRNPVPGVRGRSFEAWARRRIERGLRDAETVTFEDIRLVVQRGRSSSQTRPAVLWVHGGGYVVGSPLFDLASCRAYADRLGALVAAVEYRRAPEHPFPAALDDCWRALEWLRAQPEVDPNRIVVAGASAGGGLAAALVQMASDRGVMLAGQVLVYPMLDDRSAVRSKPRVPVRIWTHEANRAGWRAYLGVEPGVPQLPEYASPARRTELSSLPPTWIGVGTLDLFHDEDIAYAEALRGAGVSVEVAVVPGAYHGFDILQRRAQVSRDFLEKQIAAAATMLGTPPR